MLEMCSSSCQSRVLSAVKMGLTPPRTASVTLCAHTTRVVAQTMSPYVVLGVSLPEWFHKPFHKHVKCNDQNRCMRNCSCCSPWRHLSFVP